MRVVPSIVLICLTFFLCAPLPAYALSCAAPKIEETSLESALIIFEGIAIKKSKPKGLKGSDINTWPKGGDLSDMRSYEFEITKGWKNAQKGQVVKVLSNEYWGDSFALNDTKYLVISHSKHNEYYGVGLCGLTQPLEYYQDESPIDEMRGQIKIVSDYFSSQEQSEDMKPLSCSERSALSAVSRNAKVIKFCSQQVNGRSLGCDYNARPPSELNADEIANKDLAWIIIASIIHSFDDKGAPRFMPEGAIIAHVSKGCEVKNLITHSPL